MNKDALWASGQDETVEVNQRALIDSEYLASRHCIAPANQQKSWRGIRASIPVSALLIIAAQACPWAAILTLSLVDLWLINQSSESCSRMPMMLV